jgi:hypothetical protein
MIHVDDSLGVGRDSTEFRSHQEQGQQPTETGDDC